MLKHTVGRAVVLGLIALLLAGPLGSATADDFVMFNTHTLKYHCPHVPMGAKVHCQLRQNHSAGSN